MVDQINRLVMDGFSRIHGGLRLSEVQSKTSEGEKNEGEHTHKPSMKGVFHPHGL